MQNNLLNIPFSQGRAAQDWTLVSESAGHRCGMVFGGFIRGISGCLHGHLPKGKSGENRVRIGKEYLTDQVNHFVTYL